MDDRLEIPDERSPLPYFAGRDAELNAFERKVRSVCADGQCTSGVVLTTGVPGSGRTLLAREFAQRIGGRKFDGRTVATLTTSPESLASPVTLFKRITIAINEGKNGAEIAQIGVQAAATNDAGHHTSDLERLLDASKREGLWRTNALVLLIDELQSVDEGGGQALRCCTKGCTAAPSCCSASACSTRHPTSST